MGSVCSSEWYPSGLQGSYNMSAQAMDRGAEVVLCGCLCLSLGMLWQWRREILDWHCNEWLCRRFWVYSFFLILTFCETNVIRLDNLLGRIPVFLMFFEYSVRLNDQHFKKCRTWEPPSRLAARVRSQASLLTHGSGSASAWVDKRASPTITRSHWPHCLLYCRIVGCKDSAVCTYVYTRRIYKFIKSFVCA